MARGSLPNREAIVSRLVLNLPISAEDRRTLGAFVRRSEVVRAIERELEHQGRFPADGEGRMQIVVRSANQVLLIHHRLTEQPIERFATPDEAIGRYIDLEIGPSCGGVRVRA